MMLAVSHLIVDHGKLRALWDVSLNVGEGQRVGLVGANGAGKSTTLGAIAGLYPAAGGTISYGGERLAHHRAPDALARGIVLVPEGRRLFGDMTVRENLRMGAYAGRTRSTVAEGLEKVFELFPILRDKQTQAAHELSGGSNRWLRSAVRCVTAKASLAGRAIYRRCADHGRRDHGGTGDNRRQRRHHGSG